MPETIAKPCARCGVNPRNSTLKSYCVDCKKALQRESYLRVGGKNPLTHCSRCGEERDGAHPAYCAECWRIKREERRLQPCATCGAERTPGERRSPSYCDRCSRERWLVKKYGLTLDQFDALLARQDGRCAICRDESNGRMWHVDHDHNTGAVRGILCDKCNRGLGHYDEDAALLIKAAEYLERTRT